DPTDSVLSANVTMTSFLLSLRSLVVERSEVSRCSNLAFQRNTPSWRRRICCTWVFGGTPTNMSILDLESLAYNFFREVARYEYCLKATGLREESRAAKASWTKYAAEVADIIEV